MRRLLLLLLLTAAAAGAAKPDLLAHLKQVAANTSIDSPDAQPWHLKLSASILFPLAPAPQSGTIEEWWLSPTHLRITYAFPTYTATLVQDGDNSLRTANTGRPPFLAAYVLQQFVHPLPEDHRLATGFSELNTQHFSAQPVQCIAFSNHFGPRPNVDVFLRLAYFCTLPDQPNLLISSEGPSWRNTRDKLGVFRGKSVPIDFTLTADHTQAAQAHLETLESTATPAAPFSTEGLVAVHPPATNRTPGLVLSRAIHGASAPYALARSRGITGTVFIDVIIGTDGHVKSATSIFPFDAGATNATIDAFKRFIYQPPLVNGQPAERETLLYNNYLPD